MGETIYSPAFGYSVTFLNEGLKTGEDFDFVRIHLDPGGQNFRHFHLHFTELFTVELGVLGVELRAKGSRIEVGEQAFIPKRVPHRFFNPTDSEVVFTARMSPATHFPDVLRIAYGLSREGKTNRRGFPKNILHTAYLWKLDKTAAALAPSWLISWVMAPLALIGRMAGVERKLSKYLRPPSP